MSHIKANLDKWFLGFPYVKMSLKRFGAKLWLKLLGLFSFSRQAE